MESVINPKDKYMQANDHPKVKVLVMMWKLLYIDQTEEVQSMCKVYT